jgi:hypothetical protein
MAILALAHLRALVPVLMTDAVVFQTVRVLAVAALLLGVRQQLQCDLLVFQMLECDYMILAANTFTV